VPPAKTKTKPEKTDKKAKRKLLLLDGHSLAYRAFFALPETLATTSGQVTNAVYGFTAMLIKLLGDERPAGVAVCFDRGRPAFRHDRYEEYKANRREQPDTLREQFGLIREVLEKLRITVIELEGYEADDLLATLAKRATEEGDEVVIVSGDRDILQLVGGPVTATMTRRGISDMLRYDADAVKERYGVTPEQWTDYVALKGETSDNLPGVPGIGDKTAAKLIQTYGDIDGVIANADALTPKIRAGVEQMADQIHINKELGHLLDDVEIDVGPSDIRLEPWDDEEVRKLFTSLEFKSLYERLQELDVTPSSAAAAGELELLEIAKLWEAPADGAAVAWDSSLRWLAVSTDTGRAAVAPYEEGLSTLRQWLGDAGRSKYVHDAKTLHRRVLESDGSLDGLAIDTLIAAYVLEPGLASGYPLADLVERYLGHKLDAEPEVKKGKQASLDLEDDNGDRAARTAVAVRALVAVLEERLKHRGMWDLATTLEFPLVGVLARMEHAGVRIDRDYLEELNEDLGGKMSGLERKIHERAGGEPFNVNSNLQLQKILFEQLGLPKTKKIKTGYSTDHAELQKIREAHPIVEELIEYREVAKLKTGFTDALLPLIDPKTGRIHTTFLQASAATGRLASTNPNIQNIPIRGELGRQIRRAFIAEEGHVLLSADYGQIELRVLAHLSEDPGILEAFASGHDYHAAIASKVYGVDVSDVQSSMRAFAKQFSFGIAYGMSAFGVSERLGIDAEEAQAFIDAYYAQFPKVREFLDEQVQQARKDGFTTTMFGRRRYLPELQSNNFRVRAMGERMALNAPIQGTSADIIKRAMIDIDVRLRAHPGLGRMLLSVHDELVFEVPQERVDEATEAIRTLMEGVAELRCGLAVDIHTGPNWSEAHA
jgi:DNA polymerase-1